jgi:glutathione S-transferase
MTLRLHGYRYSVYARIARMTCLEKGVAHEWSEVDPFSEDIPPTYLSLHPFRRVPALEHDGFVLYETAVIARYIDEAFVGPLFNRWSRARGHGRRRSSQ